MDDLEGPFLCPGSMALEGLLAYYPRLRSELQVKYLDFTGHREVVTVLLKTASRSLPLLILGQENAPDVPGVQVSKASGLRFIARPTNIRRHLVAAYHLARPYQPNARGPRDISDWEKRFSAARR